jgi:hypothetical protein
LIIRDANLVILLNVQWTTPHDHTIMTIVTRNAFVDPRQIQETFPMADPLLHLMTVDHLLRPSLNDPTRLIVDPIIANFPVGSVLVLMVDTFLSKLRPQRTLPNPEKQYLPHQVDF